MQQPKLLSKVWAALGLKNDIPDSRRTGIPNESATYEEGFPQITMTPIALGGKAPSGKDMNGILNELSAHTVYQNQGGVYKFDSAFAEKIDGYSKGSLLINNKLDKLFISLVDKNKTDFNLQDFSGKWEVVSGVNFFVPKTQKATLQETGIVKLYSGYDSDAEDLAATPKAIKTMKAFIDALTRNLGNYIPNSKKSSRVDSNSADDVATSAAVKSANDNANGRVSKSGDTMTGSLSIKQGDYSGISLYNNDGYYLRLEGNNHANGTMLTAVYRKPNGENVAVASLPKRDGTIAYVDDVVRKTGDTMTGSLSIKQGDYSGISLYNNDGYYLRLEGNNHANGTMLTAVYRKPNGENVAVASLPKRDGTIAYVDDVVRKTGDTMTGTLSINKSTERYPIGSYTWGVPLSLSGDAMISNGVTGIAFNNNGALHLGGRKNSPEFIATIDSEGIYTGGVMRATGHTAKAYGQGTFANQWDDKKAPYVVHNPNANGQNIYYPFIKGLNTNGSDYGTAFSFGYMTPGTINQFGRGVIHLIEDNGTEKMWWFGHDGTLQGADFATNDGKRLTKSHQTNYAYVETTAAIWGGLKINRNGEHMLIESNDRGGFNFIRRNNSDGSNVYVLSTPTKNGTLATLDDLPKERLIWQGSNDSQITVNVQVGKGVLFVLMETPHGANANRPIWFSAPIEQCHDTRIGEYDTGGTAGDYNYVTLALLHRNGNNITITPQSDGRKPRIKKVVVFG